jgi:hypothetical protein
VQLVAERHDQNCEFLASTDNWFRPVNFVNAAEAATGTVAGALDAWFPVGTAAAVWLPAFSPLLHKKPQAARTIMPSPSPAAAIRPIRGRLLDGVGDLAFRFDFRDLLIYIG